jgi:hypothetical protein
MIVYGNKKTQLLGTAQDDIFYPSGNVTQELTLNPGNDTYILGDPGWYDFYLIPVNYFTSKGVRINLGTDSVTLGGVSLRPNTISDGYGGVDVVTFQKIPSNYIIRYYSGPYDDYFNSVGTDIYSEWRINGNDTITVRQGSVYVAPGAGSINVNFTGKSGYFQLDPTNSLTYSYTNFFNWEFDGPAGSNKIINNAPNSNINFHLDAGVTIGSQVITSSGNNIQIDLIARTVMNATELVKLTATEYKLLILFAKNEGRVLTHQFLLKEIWGIGYQTDTQYLRVFVGTLRKKIERNPNKPQHIITESGVGYRFM